MNGVNYMLPFVIAGGIIIALSFAFGITAADPNSADYNVLAAAFSRIGGDTAFAMMVPALGAGLLHRLLEKQVLPQELLPDYWPLQVVQVFLAE